MQRRRPAAKAETPAPGAATDRPKAHPIATVTWVDPATLHANDYNPNHVFGPERELLKLSILEDGWTMPIVARTDGEIVDGFHRWSLGSRDPDIRAASGGLVPVVFLPAAKSREDQMFATVRHNRARGQHGVLKMGDILRELATSGLPEEEIARRMGMELEEYRRLSDTRGIPKIHGKDSFGRGWVPIPKSEKDAMTASETFAREEEDVVDEEEGEVGDDD